ncbi:MAG: DUF4214 domain-containing protein [Acidimicrobiales bacterium]|nr:DUF4214 domain-containing protein [Acidimicrobiales bacterium]
MMASTRRVLLAACIVFSLLTTVGAAPAGAAGGFFEGSVVRAHDAEAEMLDTINRTRAEYGLGALRSEPWGDYEGYLNCIAQQNAAQRALEHYPASCNQGFVEAEILAARYAVPAGGSTNTLVKQWNESDGHRRIMLAADADYANVGVFCMGHTAWAIAWIGTDAGSVTQNYTTEQSIGTEFFTDNDYRCVDSEAQAINEPLRAFEPAQTIEDLITQEDFDKPEADILRLYLAFFNRQAEIAGANYWIGLNATGVSIDRISAEFAVSQEFQNTYGSVDNEGYLQILYQNVLGRQPDQAGFDYWLGLLNNGDLDRGGVVRWVANDVEFTEANLYNGH